MSLCIRSSVKPWQCHPATQVAAVAVVYLPLYLFALAHSAALGIPIWPGAHLPGTGECHHHRAARIDLRLVLSDIRPGLADDRRARAV
jgi:hypothetical protein